MVVILQLLDFGVEFPVGGEIEDRLSFEEKRTKIRTRKAVSQAEYRDQSSFRHAAYSSHVNDRNHVIPLAGDPFTDHTPS